MAYTDSEDMNYRGQLYATASKSAPFLARVLGNGSKFGAFTFEDNVSSAVTAGSQAAVAESAAVSGPAATTSAKAQVSNICQIQMEGTEVSLRKMGDVKTVVSGTNTNTSMSQPDGLDFQKAMKIMKMTNDYEYSLLQGTYQAASDIDTAAKTRGVTAHISTNATAASSAALSSTLIDTTLLSMATAGSPLFGNIIAVCKPTYKQQLDKIFGTQPDSRTEGGINLNTYYTALATFSCIFTNNAPANTVLFLNADYIYARWNLPDMSQITESAASKGIELTQTPELYDLDDQGMAFNGLFWIPKLSTGASVGGWFYSHFGGEYGPESFHAKITGLA